MGNQRAERSKFIDLFNCIVVMISLDLIGVGTRSVAQFNKVVNSHSAYSSI